MENEIELSDFDKGLMLMSEEYKSLEAKYNLKLNEYRELLLLNGKLRGLLADNGIDHEY